MKAVVFTLGCKVNDCESGSLIRGLQERGWEVSDELVPADLYILNTCAVTGEAEKKSRQAIARVRAVAPQARIIVCGCAAEKTPELFSKKQNVRLVTGARQKSKILALLDEEGVRLDEEDKKYDEMLPPVSFKARAFIKIQDGCNNFCSYCIIPYLRGRSRSRTVESAAAEILSVSAEEAVLTGIDISSYRDGERDLADLLLAVKDAPCRVRLGSLEVGVITPRLLDAAKCVRDFAPHFHLSLQSGSDGVLKKMNRHYTAEEYLQKVELIRTYFPDAAITTDVITGFPTETEEQFAETCAFVRKVGFSQIHCFSYSRRTGTNAAKLAELPAEVKSRRLHEMLAVAAQLRADYEKQFIGRTLELVPEERKGEYTVGYSQNYIRLYVRGEIAKKARVVAAQPFEDGLLAVQEAKGETNG